MRIEDVARKQVGVKEKPGNTGVPFERYALKGEQPLAWCARFVRWCAKQADVVLPGNQYEIASVENMRRAFEGEGLILQDPETPCVVFYRDRTGSDAGTGRHCGVVVSVGPFHIQTVEGNFGDAVRLRTISLKDPSILCYGRFPPPGVKR